jgi:uncharacterized protein
MKTPMSFDDLLGRRATLIIRRLASSGAYLVVDERTEILLIGGEIPAGAKPGDEVDVFVHLDSEGRPIATTRASKIEMGQVAFLEVTALTPIGAFVDWGLAKELLVPFAEQTADMRLGTRYAIGLYRDASGRLAGTMRVAEMLDREKVEWEDDEWVEGQAWRDDPRIGLFVILERASVGLLPKSEPHALSRGEGARFRITNVLPDGKVELSLRGRAHEELANDAQKILTVLASRDAPDIGDKSSPEAIRERFGLSKKAFKRAVGRLLKEGRVIVDERGFVKPR